jgi:DNA-directed RNA polymerase subunit F
MNFPNRNCRQSRRLSFKIIAIVSIQERLIVKLTSINPKKTQEIIIKSTVALLKIVEQTEESKLTSKTNRFKDNFSINMKNPIPSKKLRVG